MRLSFIGSICCFMFVLISCNQKHVDTATQVAPEYMSHEEMMTRNPATGEVERTKTVGIFTKSEGHLRKVKCIKQGNCLSKYLGTCR